MSIRLRLTLWYSGILALTLLLFGLTLYITLSYILHSNVKDSLKEQGAEINSQIKIVEALGMQGIKFPDLNSFKSSGIFLQALLFNYGINQSSNFPKTIQLKFSKQAIIKAQKSQESFELVSIENSTLLVYYRPLIVGNNLVGVLQVVTTEYGQIDKILNYLVYIVSFLALVTIVLAATLGWFLARKVLRPIDKVIAAADQIEKGVDLDKRIVYDGPNDEIGHLANTINNMLSRLQIVYLELDEAYRAQRRFVSDASHELRTPLTTIRGNVDLLGRMWGKLQLTEGAAVGSMDEDKVHVSLEAMQDIAGEAERMSRLVNDLLALARADAGFDMHKEMLLLKPLVEEVIRRAQFLPKTAEWRTGNMETIDDVYIYGSKDYLQQMLFILIENAFKYTEYGYVQLDAMVSGEQVGIQIKDTGIGMDKDEIPHIFDRFYRADLSRGKTTGTGLGLSIAKWIIDEHDGSVEVVTRKEEGSTFTVWLPVSFPHLLE